ncbi:unnamed protein product, partial [Polarella glacialis]
LVDREHEIVEDAKSLLLEEVVSDKRKATLNALLQRGRFIAPQVGDEAVDVEQDEEKVATGNDLIQIDHNYDFFDPSTRELRVKKTEENLRVRRISVRGGSSESGSSTGSDGVRARRPSEISQVSSTGSECRSPSNLDKWMRRSIILRWGVLTGKLLHNHATTGHAAFQRQISDRNLQPGGLVRIISLGSVGSNVGETYAGYVRGLAADGTYVSEQDERKDSRARRQVLKVAERRAKAVVKKMRILIEKVLREPEDKLDCDWAGAGLCKFLFSEEFTDTLMILASGANAVLASQPSLIEVQAPCKVFGDIHGQLRDLMLLFGAFGSPGDDKATEGVGMSFVFNGDFVDRGSHQLEAIT